MEQNKVVDNHNDAGVAGFILSLVGFFVGWLPILGWIIWLLGLIFSFVGIFNRPRGFAIAGLIISLFGIGIIIIIAFVLLGLLGLAKLYEIKNILN